MSARQLVRRFALISFFLLACLVEWWLVAVWHAALNATGGLFFFRMVTGDDKARLGYLLGSVYVIVGAAGYLVWRRHLARHEFEQSLITHDQLQHSTSGGRHEA